MRSSDVPRAALACGVGAIALAQSWHRWLDPVVDAGRDLYIPGAILRGAKLYRDIRYFYPPVTPYLLAGITSVTGDSMRAYVAIGIAIATATALLVYMIAATCGSRVSATAAASLFAACCVAGPSTWGVNYLFPYAHAATLAMLAFLGMEGSLAAYLFGRRRPVWLASALICGAIASWTKVEFALFAAIVLSVTWIVYRLPAVWAAAYAGGGLVSLAAVAIYFRDCDWLRGNVLPSVMMDNPHLTAFYASVSGMDRWPELLGKSMGGAVCVLATVLLFRRASAGGVQGRWTAAAGVTIALLAVAADLFFVAWSVLQLALIPLAVRKRQGPLPLLLIASLCATSRVFLHLTPLWYGFVFTVPAIVLIVYVLIDWLPVSGVYSRSVAMLWLIPFVSVGDLWLVRANQSYATKTFPIVTKRAGVMYDGNGDRARILSFLSPRLHQMGVRSLVVMPEGLALNYLFEIPTPLAFHTFTPVETDDPRAETAILQEFEAKQPPFVAFVDRDVREFGYAGMGRDYDLRLAAYLRLHYDAVLDARLPHFGFLLLQRRANLRTDGGDGTLRPATSEARMPLRDSPSPRDPAPTEK